MSLSLRGGGRLALFPKALTTCSADASAYALCISKNDVKPRICDKEFHAFKNCMKEAMKKLKR